MRIATPAFTDDARDLFARAEHEAERLGHPFLGTEHLALALARHATGAAAAVLHGTGVDLPAVVRTLDTVVAPGQSAAPPGGTRPRTSRTQQAIAHAEDYAKALGHASVGSDHLLVGLLREGRNVAAQVLLHHGLTLESAESEVGRRSATPP